MPTNVVQLPRSELLEYLRRQVDKLAELERKIATLEADRNDLLLMASSVDQRLLEYQEIKEGWEWFFDNSLDMLLVHDLEGRLVRVNPAVERLLGYTVEEFMHLPMAALTHPDDLARVLAHIQAIAAGADGVNFEARTRHKDGRWRWLAWTTPSPTKDGRTMKQVYAMARDITESKLSQQELLYRAQHDALTGLANRAAFEQALRMLLARAARVPGDAVALMLIDLDGFKQVNDGFGHLAGDEVLRAVASRLREASRKGDVVARLGGDEFAVLLPGAAPGAIDAVAERVLARVARPIGVGAQEVRVGCSIGIATSAGSDGGDDADDLAARLFGQADRALYDVKARGKHAWARFTQAAPDQEKSASSTIR